MMTQGTGAAGDLPMKTPLTVQWWRDEDVYHLTTPYSKTLPPLCNFNLPAEQFSIEQSKDQSHVDESSGFCKSSGTGRKGGGRYRDSNQIQVGFARELKDMEAFRACVLGRLRVSLWVVLYHCNLLTSVVSRAHHSTFTYRQPGKTKSTLPDSQVDSGQSDKGASNEWKFVLREMRSKIRGQADD